MIYLKENLKTNDGIKKIFICRVFFKESIGKKRMVVYFYHQIKRVMTHLKGGLMKGILSIVKVFLLFMLVTGCAVFRYQVPEDVLRESPVPPLTETRRSEILDMYAVLDWKNPPNQDVFIRAVHGYDYIPKKKEILTLIDFSQPSTEKRAYVIDMEKQEILFNTWVSHGVNSGENIAEHFSNAEGSRKSSLGFYLTGKSYCGENGLSLRLDGLEKGFNDSARVRYIVIHGADYVSQEFIEQEGRLGRSWGCPAFPLSVTKPIIRKIKRGSVVFIYGNDTTYLRNSRYSYQQ